MLSYKINRQFGISLYALILFLILLDTCTWLLSRPSLNSLPTTSLFTLEGHDPRKSIIENQISIETNNGVINISLEGTQPNRYVIYLDGKTDSPKEPRIFRLKLKATGNYERKITPHASRDAINIAAIDENGVRKYLFINNFRWPGLINNDAIFRSNVMSNKIEISFVFNRISGMQVSAMELSLVSYNSYHSSFQTVLFAFWGIFFALVVFFLFYRKNSLPNVVGIIAIAFFAIGITIDQTLLDTFFRKASQMSSMLSIRNEYRNYLLNLSHFVGFSILTLYMLYNQQRLKYKWGAVIIFCTLLALGTELFQIHLESRSFSLDDLLIDFFAILITSLFAAVVKLRTP